MTKMMLQALWQPFTKHMLDKQPRCAILTFPAGTAQRCNSSSSSCRAPTPSQGAKEKSRSSQHEPCTPDFFPSPHKHFSRNKTHSSTPQANAKLTLVPILPTLAGFADHLWQWLMAVAEQGTKAPVNKRCIQLYWTPVPSTSVIFSYCNTHAAFAEIYLCKLTQTRKDFIQKSIFYLGPSPQLRKTSAAPLPTTPYYTEGSGTQPMISHNDCPSNKPLHMCKKASENYGFC